MITLWVPLDHLPGAMAVRYVAGSHAWHQKARATKHIF